MIYLIQLLKMLDRKQRQEFLTLFSDLDYELDELGWRGNETDLVNDMLFNHFGITLEDKTQLKIMTDIIMNKSKFHATVYTAFFE